MRLRISHVNPHLGIVVKKAKLAIGGAFFSIAARINELNRATFKDDSVALSEGLSALVVRQYVDTGYMTFPSTDYVGGSETIVL
jgi:hypothetical protein